MFKKVGLLSRHLRISIITTLVSATIFGLFVNDDIVFTVSAQLKLLESKTFFRGLCPCPSYSGSNISATGLLSFPGSGNTWLRYLVQEATGILTGSEYTDSELLDEFPAEGVTNSSTILVKTHGSNKKTRESYSKVILLVRHPKDAILAEFNRNYGGGHKGIASEKTYLTYWVSFSNIHAKAWYRFHRDWLSYKKPLLVVYYNDLVSQPVYHLERVFKFLKVPVTARGIKCAIYRGKQFKRPLSGSGSQAALYDHIMIRYLEKMYTNTIRDINRKLA